MNFPKITDLGINSTRNPGRSYNLIVTQVSERFLSETDIKH